MTELERRRIAQARSYVANLALLLEADRTGRLADPDALDAEIERAIDTLDEVLGYELRGPYRV